VKFEYAPGSINTQARFFHVNSNASIGLLYRSATGNMKRGKKKKVTGQGMNAAGFAIWRKGREERA
jgi:hypothetical protein